MYVANRNTFDRPFDGSLDNLEIDSTADTLAQVDLIQASAIAVPEPQDLGLISLMAGFALLLWKRNLRAA